MPRYRKKPVEIEARQLPTDDGDITSYLNESIEIAEWCGGQSHMMLENDEAMNTIIGPHVLIPTLEGDMAGRPGDWIIKVVSGEFYPCKPDIFNETYEAVDG